MNPSDRELLAALLEHDASGWIPEAHDDDCDDDSCTGCVQCPVATIADLDRSPREAVGAVTALRQHAGFLAECRHQLEPAVDAFTALAVAHPECCSTPDDYPGWVPPHLDTPERAA